MHVLVTGATGFLGSYLAAELIATGHTVSVLLRPDANTWRIKDILPRLNVVQGDIRDLKNLAAQLSGRSLDGVVHLAWGGVGNVDRNSPAQAANIPATVELAALAADLGATVFIGAGSQAEYGPYQRAIRPDDLTRPTTLYGHAKLSAGLMAAHLCSERSLRFAWLRIFSTYGPKDADTWLIPSMIKSLRSGNRMSLTACEQRWGFLHARDAAMGFRLALTQPQAGGIYNLGSPDAPSLRETVTRLRDLVNPCAELGLGDIPYRPDQVMVLQADTQRLSALGWTPQVGFEDGLRETVEWYVKTERT